MGPFDAEPRYDPEPQRRTRLRPELYDVDLQTTLDRIDRMLRDDQNFLGDHTQDRDE